MGKLLHVSLDSFAFHGVPMEQVTARNLRIHPSLVKAMLGGEWPLEERTGGCCFDAVDHYRIRHHDLVPYDGFDEAPGPDFKLIMVPFLPAEELKLVTKFLDDLRKLKNRVKARERKRLKDGVGS